MYSIGEFSKITGLTVKTLRFYHDQRVLVPTYIDEENGYRYYSESKVEIARAIRMLRKFEFSISDVTEILKRHDEDEDILDFLEAQKQKVSSQERKYRDLRTSLDEIIQFQRIARQIMNQSEIQIMEKQLEPVLIAGIRMKGKYSDCGNRFGRIARKFGRYLCGKPMLLHYDTEYKEEDADFEACFPIKKGDGDGDISVRQLPQVRAITLVHKGAYDELSRSYERILQYVKKNQLVTQSPSREVYLKGPGMIFRGNPKKYLTEIQIIVEP